MMRRERSGTALFRICALALPLLTAAVARAVAIPVLEDASVLSDAPGANQNANGHRGGISTGTAGFPERARFYLKFQLPHFVPGTRVVAARLSGAHTGDLFDATAARHGIHLVSDDSWSELTLTWNNQPGAAGAAQAVWDASDEPTPPDSPVFYFDLTAVVDQEYRGDGVLSLLFAAIDENADQTWEYWSSKEHAGAAPFALDVTVAALPEPGRLPLLGMGAALLAGLQRRKSVT